LKDARYFSHDSNASHDPKIIHLRSTYGWEGYGLYWAIVERLRSEKNYQFPSDKISILAYDLQYPELEKFIKDCIEVFELFKSENGHFWSESLKRRMKKYEQIIKERKIAGSKGGKKRVANAKQMPSNCLSKTQAINKQINKSMNKEIYLEVENFYFNEFKKRTGQEPDYKYGRDRKILQPYLKKHGIPKTIDLLRLWFEDEFGEKCGYTLTGFQSCVNRLLTQIGKQIKKEKCPQCGSSQYVQLSDGMQCYSCGYTLKNKGSP